MRHPVRVIGSAAALLIGLHTSIPSAQSPPDFSGKWIFVSASPKTDFPDDMVWPSWMTIRQTASEFAYETAVGPMRVPRVAYRLDGTEIESVSTAADGESVTRTSKATWVSRAIVVLTTISRQTGKFQVMETYSIDASGNLVVISVEPNLHPSGTTSTLTAVYRKG
jgi:hypothetical protein